MGECYNMLKWREKYTKKEIKISLDLLPGADDGTRTHTPLSTRS